MANPLNGFDPNNILRLQAQAPAADAPGPMPGALFLDASLAPPAMNGVRPFAPGEFIRNPDGSWSSEITMTTDKGEYPGLNDGRPTNLPTLWLVNGKPMRVSPEQAVQYAIASGLKFTSYDSLDAADKAATEREKGWQKITNPRDARSIGALWQKLEKKNAVVP